MIGTEEKLGVVSLKKVNKLTELKKVPTV